MKKIPTRPDWADEPTQEHPHVSPRSGLAAILDSGHTARYAAELGIWVRGDSAGQNVTPGQVP